MKHSRILLFVTILVFASLACQTLIGNRVSEDVAPVAGGDEPSEPASGSGGGGGSESQSGFPMTADAFNVIDLGDGTLIFYTKLSGEAVMDFYRAEYTSRGYTEREILTVVSDTTFSMVFDGDASGKAVVIQSVDLGDGSRTVSIRLESV